MPRARRPLPVAGRARVPRTYPLPRCWCDGRPCQIDCGSAAALGAARGRPVSGTVPGTAVRAPYLARPPPGAAKRCARPAAASPPTRCCGGKRRMTLVPTVICPAYQRPRRLNTSPPPPLNPPPTFSRPHTRPPPFRRHGPPALPAAALESPDFSAPVRAPRSTAAGMPLAVAASPGPRRPWLPVLLATAPSPWRPRRPAAPPSTPR